ncbi:MAG: imidazolonepropionase [Pseudoprimorskyibacter sp.]|nr:imidazolonepropionase [Pseudoprimorskyibacter sp.]
MTEPFLLTNLTAVTMMADGPGYGLIRNAGLAIENGYITWTGALPTCPLKYAKTPKHDCGGRLVTPALIDCHTHIVYGGHRAKEFEMRLEGASYEEIAYAGGGIVSTVTATRDTSESNLLAAALRRVDTLIAQGVATIEIKSGYGLDQETELKMLRVARAIARLRPVHITTSFLGAHAAPAGHDKNTYIDDVCIPALKRAHAEGLVDAIDAFCEGIAFNSDQIRRVFETARALGLRVKIHADQLSNTGGTALAAEFDALSADHVEYADDADVAKLAASGSVAVLLPGAFYTIREKQIPPINTFRSHNVPMAVATDWNPGSSPLGSILLAMNMACTLFRLTPAEALAGTTRNAARALGFRDRGTLAKGQRADLAIWDVTTPAELSYGIGTNPLHKRIFGGIL